MKFRLLLTVFLTTLFISCTCNKKQQEEPVDSKEPVQTYDGQPSLVEGGGSDWVIENSVPPGEDKVLRIELKEKYDGFHDLYCMALFSNQKTKQYKLVAPWYQDVIITWSQTTTKKAVLIPRDSIPDRMKVLIKLKD